MPVLLLGSLALLAAGCGSGPQTEAPAGPVKDAPLPRYGVVWEDRLTRSGVPEEEGGWTWLKQQGVKSVITLRDENDIDYKRYGIEQVMLCRIKGNNPPTKEQAEKFLTFVQKPANWPVHLHCAEGKSRTGVMTALARYAIDGWPLEKALDEARLYRKGKDLSAKQVAWLRQWAASHPPGSHCLKAEARGKSR